ncbi:MAG: SDR family NAD(P)-dependent oxidoreductase, partial [Saprospiraceae bacterium]|nr:SDR family NAD(P)-dependent oxidoreductase [Saprospiraceae bacterium]
MEIKGLTALITGGASGLGEATARRLHAHGANVVVIDLNEERGNALVRELGERIKFQKTNVADEAQVQAAIDLAMSSFGTLHAAINCAGIGPALKTVGKEGPHPLDVFKKV